ncbi:MAG: hypothetical protein ACOYNY_17945 [Caldilineaceae bacterium]
MATAQALFLPFIQAGETAAPTQRTDGRASWSSPIAVSPLDQSVWTVNPDSGSITAINSRLGVRVAEIAVGQEPWSLAVAPAGQQLYVADRATGNLVVVDALRNTVTLTVAIGYELGGIALSPSGHYAYVTAMATDEVVVVDTRMQQVVQRIPVDYQPYAIAVSDDGDGQDDDERAYVTHLFARPRNGGAEATDDGREGRVTILNLATATVLTQMVLPPNVTGFPNLLTAITLAGDSAWVPHTRAAPDLPNGLTTRVFAATSVLDLRSRQEATAAYLPLNDQEIFGSPVNNPVAAVPAPDGKRLYIVLAGSDLVEVVDIATPHQPQLAKFVAVGLNPRGMAINHAGTQGYVMNYLSRSVSVVDLTTLAVTAVITTTDETLPADVLRGKILFNNAVNPKLSQGSWISCASCHPDGGTDSVTWIFPDGPRQTPPIWNAQQTLPWHWSAALDEAQDVEETIHLIQLGLGLAAGSDPVQLGAPNTGRSADLDALAAFMRQGIRTPAIPTEQAAQNGRDLFIRAGCAACHGGETWTASTLPGLPGELDPDGNGMIDSVLRNVGTLNQRDVRGATGFDIPALLNLRLTAPYFHDGSAPTLRALLATGHPTPGENQTPLTTSEITALVTFLQTIGPTTTPVFLQSVFD